jgi:hypothetical protein
LTSYKELDRLANIQGSVNETYHSGAGSLTYGYLFVRLKDWCIDTEMKTCTYRSLVVAGSVPIMRLLLNRITVISLLKERYSDFGPTLASEKLPRGSRLIVVH